MHRVVLIPFCISQIPQQEHINSNPFQGPPNDKKKNKTWVKKKEIINYGISLRSPRCLLNFWTLRVDANFRLGAY